MTTNEKHWFCPKCERRCTTVQMASDGWKAIYSGCCLVKNPPAREDVQPAFPQPKEQK